jgi:transposase
MYSNANTLERMLIVASEDYLRLMLQIKGLEERIADLEKENVELEKENAELKARLARYENPHTPPSAQRFKKKPKKPERSKKRGAPVGHKGATRPKPEPDRTVEVTALRCECCGSVNLVERGVKKKVVEDIPPPPKIEVIQFNRHRYRCNECGHEFSARDEKCPKEGRFGVGMLVYLTMLRFDLRGVLRRVREFAMHANSISISTKGVQDAIFRVGKACKSEYFRTLEKVRTAPWNYVDETGMKVLGKNWWLWGLRTPEDDVLMAIRASRGGKVLRDIFEEEIEKVVGVTDGWKAYNVLKDLQRCWVHLIREVDEFKEEAGGEELSGVIHEKYRILKEFLGKDPPMGERRRQKEEWDREMEELVEEFSRYKDLKKPLTYIRNGLGQWYTCLLHPGMEPTNNLSEQIMREQVLMRKIIGTFRSEKGAEYYQYIASLFATWRLQGKDIYDELEKVLTKELCLG